MCLSGIMFSVIKLMTYREKLMTYREDYKAIYSFTLYPAHSRVGRRNLVLRHSVPHILPNSGGIAC